MIVRVSLSIFPKSSIGDYQYYCIGDEFLVICWRCSKMFATELDQNSAMRLAGGRNNWEMKSESLHIFLISHLLNL